MFQPALQVRSEHQNWNTFIGVEHRIYSGYIEYQARNISLRKGHHEALVSLKEFERIQDRIKKGAGPAARKDLQYAFQLRGFVTCGDCNKPLAFCFSKSKTSAKHPYYICLNKIRDSYRKSIKHADIEGEFETLLHKLTRVSRI